MNCPKCKERTTVLETIDRGTHVERRRGHRKTGCAHQFMTVESGEAYDARKKLDSIIEQMGDLETVFNTLFFIQERMKVAMDTTTEAGADTLHELLEQIRERLPERNPLP